MSALLSVQGLSVGFGTSRGLVTAVQDLSFDIAPGETMALVGESGSGKSTAALALTGLLPTASRPIVSGRVMFEGRSLLDLGPRALRHLRGAGIGMIFQDPTTSLNPVFTIGRQLCEPLQIHMGMSRPQAMQRAAELLAQVKIAMPEQRLLQYPHNLSGGMRQRVMIAIAIACGPRLLIADEPTTALDVTVQAQVLRLIGSLKEAAGMAVLLITHDLGVVWEVADRVAVLYAGRKVEEGSVEAVLSRPAHPYAAGLLRAARKDRPGQRLVEIPGTVPPPYARPAGCPFAPRCDRAIPPCSQSVPPERRIGPGHEAACIRAEPEPVP